LLLLEVVEVALFQALAAMQARLVALALQAPQLEQTWVVAAAALFLQVLVALERPP